MADAATRMVAESDDENVVVAKNGAPSSSSSNAGASSSNKPAVLEIADDDDDDDLPDAFNSLRNGDAARLSRAAHVDDDDDKDETENASTRKTKGKPSAAENDDDDDDDAAEEADEYEIEAVRDHKYQGRAGKNLFYLIKWKGYPESENTWEPEENTENSKDAVDEYWATAGSDAKGKKRRAPDDGKTGKAGGSSKRARAEKDEDDEDGDIVEVTDNAKGAGRRSTGKGAAGASTSGGRAAIINASRNSRSTANIYDSLIDSSKPRPWNAAELASYDGAPPSSVTASSSRGTGVGLGGAGGGLGSRGGLGSGISGANIGANATPEELEAERKERELRKDFAKVKDWDKIVERVDTLERSEGDGYLAFLLFKSGDRLCYPNVLANKRCPQKMLEFYEAHIRFKHPSDEEVPEAAAATADVTQDPKAAQASIAGAEAASGTVTAVTDATAKLPEAAAAAAPPPPPAGSVSIAPGTPVPAAAVAAQPSAAAAIEAPVADPAPAAKGNEVAAGDVAAVVGAGASAADADGDAEMQAAEAAL